MDRLERVPSDRLNAQLLAIKAALADNQANLWTALPAFVKSYNAGKITVEAQPTIKAQIHQPDGKWIDTTMPLCVDCPVVFPGGGGFVLTFPIAANDEGVLVFASRCIDSWWQSGGIQKQAELRMHDLSDGFFIPSGGMSLPNIPGNVNGATCQLRSKDGLLYIELAAGHVANVVAPGGVNFTGPVTFNNGVAFLGQVSGHVGGGGTVNFGNANLQTTGDLKTGSVNSVNAHEHGGVQPGSGVTGPPTG